MLEHDELRVLGGALRDGEERAHLLALHLGTPEHGEAELMTGRDLSRRVGQVFGRADVAGQHRESAREVDALADRHAGGDTRFGGADVVAEDDDLLEWGAALVLRRRRLELGVLPGAHQEPDRGPLGGARVALAVVPPEARHAQLSCLTGRERGGSAERRGQIGGRPESDEQDVRRTAGPSEKVQRLVAAAAEFPSLEHAPDRAA